MKIRPHLPLALLALPAALFASGPSAPAAPSAAGAMASEPKPAEVKRHPLKGVVVEVEPAQGRLLVTHEAIPDFMPGMTMMFRVDATTLKAVKSGDAITATLIERGDDFWLEDVKIIRP